MQESLTSSVTAHPEISPSKAVQITDVNPAPELIQIDLYFGRNIGGFEGVSEQEFQAFLGEYITPRFPDGLTVYDADGQFLDSTGTLIQEASKVVSLIFEDTSENAREIDEIVNAYEQQFQQQSVLQVVNEDNLKIGFGQSEDLIDNDPTPELIQEDLYFGRNIDGVEGVSEAEFQAFLGEYITPRFPDGLTVYDADGQFLDSTGTLIQEPSKVVSLIFEDTQENETEIDEIIEAYKQQFQQQSVLQVVDEDLEVAFTADEPIIRDGLGDQQSFVINGGQSVTISNFGGVGRGTRPNQATVGEADTLVFSGEGLTAKNMLLTQEGNDLAIAFAEITDTEVVLQDFSLENLDNLQKSMDASVNLSNIQFVGVAGTDSFDVFNAESNFRNVFNRNSVTFLNNLDNTIKGFNSSNDVINGQGGDDIIKGLSGDDLLRGGEGDDKLLGYADRDTLVGDAGNDTLKGGSDRDIFVLTTGKGTDTITDFKNGVDLLGLAGKLTFGQLTITQGIGAESEDTLISLNHTDKMLATLTGVQASIITSADFTLV